MVTLTAMVPNLRPPHCTGEQRNHGQCIAPNKTQLAFLNLAIFFLAIGGGGIRPCSIPFAFNSDDLCPNLQLGLGLHYTHHLHGIWTHLLLFAGTRIYVYVRPEGSVVSSIAQVLVAAYKKRRLHLPSADGVRDTVFYDPPLEEKTAIVSKLALSSQFRPLNTAAIIEDANEISRADGCCKNPWRLCSIQQVDELKCLMNIVPIWESAIISFIPLAGISAFLSVQALRMDRHLGPNFEIPAASISVVTFTVMVIFLPIYDRFMVPALENITKQEGGGITLLQRIGLGNIFSVLALLVAGFVERKRKAFTILHAAPVSVMYNKQFPDRAHEKCSRYRYKASGKVEAKLTRQICNNADDQDSITH
ncbi:hypothetical protein Q3G72_025100 [Acer saccharum]|nr:hypothetical protein Q3G72_025100 [Acer saccharum]